MQRKKQRRVWWKPRLGWCFASSYSSVLWAACNIKVVVTNDRKRLHVTVDDVINIRNYLTCQMSYSSSDADEGRFSDEYNFTDEESISEEDICFKCGKAGHWASECYVKKRTASKVEGLYGTAGVYTLQDSNGRVYVGKSTNVEKRVEEHRQGLGTTFLGRSSIMQIKTVTSGTNEDLES